MISGGMTILASISEAVRVGVTGGRQNTGWNRVSAVANLPFEKYNPSLTWTFGNYVFDPSSSITHGPDPTYFEGDPVMRMIPAAVLIFTLSGCCSPQAAVDLQMAQDEAKLTRMYRECVEKNLSDGEAMKKNCEPILAPYASH